MLNCLPNTFKMNCYSIPKNIFNRIYYLCKMVQCIVLIILYDKK